jgi:tRNA-2-methylthio-N6-dimethylallyladenosine synthase
VQEKSKKVYLETYGCQMNVADSEIIMGLLDDKGYDLTDDMSMADVILVNTCSVREHAEQRVYSRLGEFKSAKRKKPEVIVGVLGCMAERLRETLTDKKSQGVGHIVDVIVGPDEYRKLPNLLSHSWHGEKGIAVQLSRVETYDDVAPLRTNGISAWISVMRGCDKFCSFCVVPFTRGRERNRSFRHIVEEVESLSKRGFREVTLLGQNVNSYHDGNYDFADLMNAVALVDPSMRIRFTTSHPQDMSDKLIETIAGRNNICKYIHLPVQSGSDRILQLMDRNYDRTHYLNLIRKIRSRIPDVTLSTDIITGFPTETDDDHRQTLEMINDVQYDGAFTFKYSPREHTPSFRMGDDVDDEMKTRRINEIIDLQNSIASGRNNRYIGKSVTILIEGESKKSSEEMHGRTDGNKMVIIPRSSYKAGTYTDVTITRANSATLFGAVQQQSQVEVA